MVESEWERDCQGIAVHQRLPASLHGLHGFSVAHSVANAAWSQSKMLILGKLWQGLLHRWITAFIGGTEARCTEPCKLSSVPQQQRPVKNTSLHQIWAASYLMRCQLFSQGVQVTKYCYLIPITMIYGVQEWMVGCCSLVKAKSNPTRLLTGDIWGGRIHFIKPFLTISHVLFQRFLSNNRGGKTHSTLGLWLGHINTCLCFDLDRGCPNLLPHRPKSSSHSDMYFF